MIAWVCFSAFQLSPLPTWLPNVSLGWSQKKQRGQVPSKWRLLASKREKLFWLIIQVKESTLTPTLRTVLLMHTSYDIVNSPRFHRKVRTFTILPLESLEPTMESTAPPANLHLPPAPPFHDVAAPQRVRWAASSFFSWYLQKSVTNLTIQQISHTSYDYDIMWFPFGWSNGFVCCLDLSISHWSELRSSRIPESVSIQQDP